MTDIAKFLYELGQLKRVRRSGWWIAGIDDPESVAEHSFRTAVLGYILAHLEGANPTETAVMCLFHDTEEARINDLHRVGQRYARWEGGKKRIFLEQVSRLPQPLAQELASLISDMEDGISLEAQVARDADLLECLIQAREYQAQGYNDVLDWINNCRSALNTESAKRIAEECLRLEPKEWWQGLKSTQGIPAK